MIGTFDSLAATPSTYSSSGGQSNGHSSSSVSPVSAFSYTPTDSIDSYTNGTSLPDKCLSMQDELDTALAKMVRELPKEEEDVYTSTFPKPSSTILDYSQLTVPGGFYGSESSSSLLHSQQLPTSSDVTLKQCCNNQIKKPTTNSPHQQQRKILPKVTMPLKRHIQDDNIMLNKRARTITGITRSDSAAHDNSMTMIGKANNAKNDNKLFKNFTLLRTNYLNLCSTYNNLLTNYNTSLADASKLKAENLQLKALMDGLLHEVNVSRAKERRYNEDSNTGTLTQKLMIDIKKES